MDGKPVGDTLFSLLDLEQGPSVMLKSLRVGVHLLHRVTCSQKVLQCTLWMIGELVVMRELFSDGVEIFVVMLLDRIGEHSVQPPPLTGRDVPVDDLSQLRLHDRVDGPASLESSADHPPRLQLPDLLAQVFSQTVNRLDQAQGHRSTMQ